MLAFLQLGAVKYSVLNTVETAEEGLVLSHGSAVQCIFYMNKDLHQKKKKKTVPDLSSFCKIKNNLN